MSLIKSNDQEFRKLENNPNAGSVVLLNLQKFKPQGAADYRRYLKGAGLYAEKVGGKVFYVGKINEMLNGDEVWDYVLLMLQPSRKAFLQMIRNPDYLKIHKYREKALERVVLHATDPVKSIG
jgi:uncharacterized protein (DUF1330 family)